MARGIGQLAEAVAFGYDKAVLVTMLKTTRTIDDSVFERFGLIGVDSLGKYSFSPIEVKLEAAGRVVWHF